MLWLNTADPDTIAIVRATVITEEQRTTRPSNQAERFFEIATETPWGPGARYLAAAGHLIPIPASPQEVRRAG